SRPQRVTNESFERIKMDMTRAEVESILGGPAGDYTTGPTRATGRSHNPGTLGPSRGIGLSEWRGDSAVIWIGFDSSDTVDWADVNSNELLDASFVERTMWRLRRQWRSWSSHVESHE